MTRWVIGPHVLPPLADLTLRTITICVAEEHLIEDCAQEHHSYRRR